MHGPVSPRKRECCALSAIVFLCRVTGRLEQGATGKPRRKLDVPVPRRSALKYATAVLALA
eukprot:scaffold24359_cov64-Phaeocystis_antarctica.AAC.3